MSNDINRYTANLIPDLSYFSYYEKLYSLGINKNLINELFIVHNFDSDLPIIDVTINSERCLLLSDFELNMPESKNIFIDIGKYGSRHVYCFYKDDESIADQSSVIVMDDDEYEDKYFEELRF